MPKDTRLTIHFSDEDRDLLEEIQATTATHAAGIRDAAKAVVEAWEQIQSAAFDVDLPRMFHLMREFNNPIADLASWVSED